MKRFIVFLVLLTAILSVLPIAAQDAQTPDSAAAWREDLDYLLDQIDRLHRDPFRGTPEDEFMAEAAALDANIPTMTDNQIVVGMMHLVSNLVDGHSLLLPFLVTGRFTSYPLDLYQFSDGVFVVDATPDYADVVGAKVLQINGVDVDQVVERFTRLVPRDNDSGGRVLLTTFMMTAELLQGAGIIDDLDHPALLLEHPDGTRSILDPVRIPAEDFINVLPLHYRLPINESVMYLDRITDAFWMTPLEDGHVLYVQHNDVVSLGRGMNDLRDALDSSTLDRLILDLRFNGGGDIAFARPIVNLLKTVDLFQQPGSLIVLIGRNTFSAAVVFSLWMEADLAPVFVGEPSGGSPTMFENNRSVYLPNSNFRVLISTRARQDVPATDTRRWIAPDLLVELSSEDYFAGRDPVLDEALAYTP